MESVNKKVILMALIMAVFTTFFIHYFIKKQTTQSVSVDYINTYVASKTLPPKHKIEEDDVKELKVTRDYLNPKAVMNKADIVGKRIKERIIEGEQILRDRLVEDKNLALAYNIPEGKRAVSLNVNEQIEVANLLRPGDFVDVIATFQKEELEDKTNKYLFPGVTKIILQNVQVLALGQEQIVEEDKKAEELPKTVTLAVNPFEAEKLVFSTEFAVVRLALRPVGDNKTVNTPGVIRNDVAPNRGYTILPK
ncbi:MAG: Flp pilus assembly protein CpaB [Clostridia bacterium]|nr:Flp pilus assembly protein CpaB [Clostridia bacterium]